MIRFFRLRVPQHDKFCHSEIVEEDSSWIYTSFPFFVFSTCMYLGSVRAGGFPPGKDSFGEVE